MWVREHEFRPDELGLITFQVEELGRLGKEIKTSGQTSVDSLN